jgi:hypothetical protein
MGFSLISIRVSTSLRLRCMGCSTTRLKRRRTLKPYPARAIVSIAAYETSEQYGGAKPLGVLGYAYARSGDTQQAPRMLSELEELEKRSPSGDVSSDLAIVEIVLGSRHAALAWLERSTTSTMITVCGAQGRPHV